MGLEKCTYDTISQYFHVDEEQKADEDKKTEEAVEKVAELATQVMQHKAATYGEYDASIPLRVMKEWVKLEVEARLKKTNAQQALNIEEQWEAVDRGNPLEALAQQVCTFKLE